MPRSLAGAAGPAGAVGPTGAAGPPGAAGEVELLTCTTRKVAGRRRRVCTTKLLAGTVRLTTGSALRATLARAGRTYEVSGTWHRTPGGARLVLHSARALPRGRYTLTLHWKSDGRARSSREFLTLA